VLVKILSSEEIGEEDRAEMIHLSSYPSHRGIWRGRELVEKE